MIVSTRGVFELYLYAQRFDADQFFNNHIEDEEDGEGSGQSVGEGSGQYETAACDTKADLLTEDEDEAFETERS